MRSIVQIYARDLRRIVVNPAAAVIIAGLVILPSLYAWFNIAAMWDPYSQTSRLPVAVVDQDAGTTLRGQPINVGKQIETALADNPKIGWSFVDEDLAMQDLRRGKYYAVIIVPPEFSARLATAAEGEPKQAEIDYYVNEKINAVAPKITASGASGIIEEVSSRFVEAANGIIFRIFNQIGTELEANLPDIEKLKSLIFELEARFPEIQAAANTAQTDIGKLNAIVGTAQARLPEVARLAKDGADVAAKVGTALDKSKEALDRMSPQFKQDLILLRDNADTVASVTSLLSDANADPQAVKQAADAAAGRLQTAADVAGKLADAFGQLDKIAGSGHPLASAVSKLRQVQAGFQNQAAALASIRQSLDQGKAPADALIDRLNQLSKETSDRLDTLIAGYDSAIAPKVKQALVKAASDASTAQSVLTGAVKSLPDVQSLLSRASSKLAVGTKELSAIHAEMPAARSKIKALADKIRAFEKEGNLSELIALLKRDAQRESAFFAQPVLLKENKLYPIPEYGSAMSPFYTALSLWVGALLLVSLLSVDVHEPGIEYPSYQVYFGRYLTFGTLALLQSLLVTLGDIYIIGAYVSEKGWFVLFGALLSVAFMLIVYTLVSVFGNVGKAMAIVLLVLQLAGAGGTFPPQLTPPFFQAIHPYLPFTYGIGLLREAVGGILWDLARDDVLMLLVFIWAALVVGLGLKLVINRLSSGMVKKARESRLIH